MFRLESHTFPGVQRGPGHRPASCRPVNHLQGGRLRILEIVDRFAVTRNVVGCEMRKLAFFAFLGLILSILLGAAPATAQTAATGAVLGTVTDPQQKAIGDATVELRHIGTNFVTTQTTNSAGQYAFPGVTPGIYR